jgi:hypothetical protein
MPCDGRLVLLDCIPDHNRDRMLHLFSGNQTDT